MLCDFYELTMGNGYFESGLGDKITYFDLFYRTVPDDGGFAIAAGLEQAVDYIRNLHFSEEISLTCAAGACSRSPSSTTCATSSSRATSGPCRRGRPCSRASPSWSYELLPSRRSCWRPSSSSR